MADTIQHRKDLHAARTVVVKLGSSLLVSDAERTAAEVITVVAAEVAALVAAGVHVVLVSSGAIALGYPRLGETERPKTLALAQAAAAAGQLELMNRWQTAFTGHALVVAQVLLTHDDADDRRRYLNARRALEALGQKGAIAIINENDSVATDEIRFGDNDALAATVAGLVSADALVLLTEVDGCFNADPRTDSGAKRFAELSTVSDEVLQAAGGASQHGTGGMRSKLLAAKTATEVHGAACVISSGRRAAVLSTVFAGDDVGTFIPAQMGKKHSARARWLRADPRARGEILVDAGAQEALRTGRSLLLAGVVEVRGDFRTGDVVDLCDAAGQAFARGITQAPVDVVTALKGMRTAQAQATGRTVPEPLVHRDDFVAL